MRRTLMYRVLLVVALISIQYIVITGFGSSEPKNSIEPPKTTEIVATEKESIKVEIPKEKKIEVVAKKVEQKVQSKVEEPIKTPKESTESKTTVEKVQIADKVEIKEEKEDPIEVAQIIKDIKSKKIGKVVTLSVSLIRSTPILDKTKSNAVDYKPKGMILEYEKELPNWYYLGENQYIHKSVVKKVEKK